MTQETQATAARPTVVRLRVDDHGARYLLDWALAEEHLVRNQRHELVDRGASTTGHNQLLARIRRVKNEATRALADLEVVLADGSTPTEARVRLDQYGVVLVLDWAREEERLLMEQSTKLAAHNVSMEGHTQLLARVRYVMDEAERTAEELGVLTD